MEPQLIVRRFRPGMGGIPGSTLGKPSRPGRRGMHRGDGDGVVDIFVRGWDGALHHKSYQPGSGWTGFGSLGGQLAASPAAMSYGKGGIDVYVRNTSNQLAVRNFRPATYSGPWSAFAMMLY